ncbi:hypothetical protein GEMRC1_003759 [Eukaryota sp. GEM-RC1]
MSNRRFSLGISSFEDIPLDQIALVNRHAEGYFRGQVSRDQLLQILANFHARFSSLVSLPTVDQMFAQIVSTSAARKGSSSAFDSPIINIFRKVSHEHNCHHLKLQKSSIVTIESALDVLVSRILVHSLNSLNERDTLDDSFSKSRSNVVTIRELDQVFKSLFPCFKFSRTVD